jgi:hypothetical protein
VRNCLLLMLNRRLFSWLSDLATFPAFVDCIPLTDNKYDERYDLELVLRFFSYFHANQTDLQNMRDVGDFLTERMRLFGGDPNFDYDGNATLFQWVFSVLSAALGEDVFRHYDSKQSRFKGPFAVSAYEVCTLGLAKHRDAWQAYYLAKPQEAQQDLVRRVRNLWKQTVFEQNSGAGVRGTSRAAALVPFSILYFKVG